MISDNDIKPSNAAIANNDTVNPPNERSTSPISGSGVPSPKDNSTTAEETQRHTNSTSFPPQNFASAPSSSAATTGAAPNGAAATSGVEQLHRDTTCFNDDIYQRESTFPRIEFHRIQYENEIEIYSRLVLQIAIVIFILQLFWGLLFFFVEYNTDKKRYFAFNFVVSVIISLLVMWCAVVGIKQRNASCCCGVGYLDFYCAWCLVGFLFSFFYVLISIAFVHNLFFSLFNILWLVLYYMVTIFIF